MTARRWPDDLDSVLAGSDRGLSVADRLCHACVELLEVDGAAVSLVHQGVSRGTFGSSGVLSRRLDEFQFTFGEGPCLAAVAAGTSVLVEDLAAGEVRWPAFTNAVLTAGVRAVFALPIVVASAAVGALDLFRYAEGPLPVDLLAGGLLAAELAALPLLDLMTSDVDWSGAAEGAGDWSQLASLERVEVYQATGMIMGCWAISSAEALVRLRARAYAAGVDVSVFALAVVERRVRLLPHVGGDGSLGLGGWSA